MITPGSIGYPLLATAAAFLCSTQSEKLDSRIKWVALASIINGYALFKAFNAPYFGAIVALSSFLINGSNDDARVFTLFVNIGVFLIASAKFLQVLLK